MATKGTSADVSSSTMGSDPDLIDVMNDLQNKLVASGHSLDIPLPQIVVVGSQSAGKSSVLENIVGREFLPRGSGVVTRRPILIQLFPIEAEVEYGVFGHKPNEKFFDFEQMKQEITNQMPGNPLASLPKDENIENGFSPLPIQLQIYSPRVLKLTLVDLPGLVRIAVDGQSQKSITEVRDMILKYIIQPECLILAVSPANQDIATSDALEIAREADPDRSRTIGVLTKLDLMDAGTNARDVLENRQIQLKRGYVGVLNRSQKDIDLQKDIDYILDKEKTFFSESPHYRHLSAGTPYLRRMLQKMLRAHIKGALPDMRSKLAEKLSSLDRKLSELRAKMGEGAEGKHYYMLRVVKSFTDDIYVKIMGNSEMVNTSTISAGAYMNYKLNTEITNNLKLSLVPKEEDLTILITNLHALRGSISFPSLALDSICRKLVSEFEHPMESSVESIRKVLEDAITDSAAMMDGYQTMKNEVLYRIRCCVQKEALKTRERLKEHVYAEMFYINLEHPDLDLSVCDALAPSVGPTKLWDNVVDDGNSSNNSSAPTDLNTRSILSALMSNESTQKKVQYILLVTTKYMEIVQKQMADLTIKYIVSFLVKKVLDYIKDDLMPSLLASDNFGSLMEDCDEDFRQKEDMEKTRACLKEALDAIQKF